MIEIVDGTSIVVISDEVYDNLTYDNHAHYSVLSFPELRERSVAIFSAGKLFNATGWKVGWAVASSHITQKLRSLHQFIVYCVNPAVQNAVAKGLSQLKMLQQIRQVYAKQRQLMYEQLLQSPFHPIMPQGTYFMLIDYREISHSSDIDFAMELVEEHKVATIPLSPFYSPFEVSYPYLRLCFAKREETIKKGVQRLKSLALAQ